MSRPGTDPFFAHFRASGYPERNPAASAGFFGARTIVAAVTLGAVLAGCSDLYFARRDTIALGAGDAVAANEAEEIADPWPAYSGNVNITANGQEMQSAIERYRTNKVTPPVDPMSAQGPNLQPSSSAAPQSSSGSASPTGAASAQGGGQ